MLNSNILDDFTKKTGYDINIYLQEVLNFFEFEYLTFTNYYSGEGYELNNSSIKLYLELVEKTAIVFDKIRQHSGSMVSVEYFELIELVESIDTKLKGVRNLHKWSRSYIQKFGEPSNQLLEHTLQPKQTLESLGYKLDEEDREKWLQIALDNVLREEDYTSEGNKELLLRRSVTSNIGDFTSIVDSIQGKSIYGKDILRSINFVEDDIEVLNYDQTLLQSIEILASIKKNSHLGYRKIGVQTEVIAGSNRATVSIPIISRQLQEVFSTDDSLKNFKVTNFNLQQDNLELEFSIETRLGEVVNKTILVL